MSAVATTQRNYPQLEIPGPATAGYPAEHALGYVGTINPSELKAQPGEGYQPGDDYGQSGLEYQYQSQLRGTPGTQQLEVDPQGQVVGTVKTTPAVAGDNLVTNIDTGLQQVVDNALASQIIYAARHARPGRGHPRPAPNGAVAVLDPQTGAVLALSSYPYYNPNVWVGGISHGQLQRSPAEHGTNDYSIDGELPPGLDVQADHGHRRPADRAHHAVDHRRRQRQLHRPQLQGPQLHVARRHRRPALRRHRPETALTVSSDVFFYQIGAEFWDARPQYGDTPIQNTAGAVRLREPDRHRPSQRGVGSGREPGHPARSCMSSTRRPIPIRSGTRATTWSSPSGRGSPS